MNAPTSTNGSGATLLDNLISHMHLKNDAALSRALGISPPVISKIRSGTFRVGANFLIKAHEESDLPIAQLKLFAGIKNSFGGRNANLD